MTRIKTEKLSHNQVELPIVFIKNGKIALQGVRCQVMVPSA